MKWLSDSLMESWRPFGHKNKSTDARIGEVHVHVHGSMDFLLMSYLLIAFVNL